MQNFSHTYICSVIDRRYDLISNSVLQNFSQVPRFRDNIVNMQKCKILWKSRKIFNMQRTHPFIYTQCRKVQQYFENYKDVLYRSVVITPMLANKQCGILLEWIYIDLLRIAFYRFCKGNSRKNVNGINSDKILLERIKAYNRFSCKI